MYQNKSFCFESKLSFTMYLTLSQADDFFNPYREGELFRENFQKRGYFQTRQLVIYKNNKQNLIIWLAIVCHSPIAGKQLRTHF